MFSFITVHDRLSLFLLLTVLLHLSVLPIRIKSGSFYLLISQFQKVVNFNVKLAVFHKPDSKSL